ncbi:cell division protein ZipA [Aliamphritea spongicola]|uniref:cell division protein ZipA n=1 Tax=Aliamphritea spongicola TaxID=707589 RepID=UPI00196B9737|nr:cell division protein ZipA [Aliamphritea spongicola]MBN3563553.1 cell division protein ZipA [Aliamphritea spongicola]
MELSLREWLIIGGVVIIALIIIDGWRRMRSNRNTLRMQIDKSLVDLPEESHNPELPNGGFRVIDDDTAERAVGQSPVSLASEVESELPPEPSEEITAEETSVQPGELASEVKSEVDSEIIAEAVVAQPEPFTAERTTQDQPVFDDDNLSAPRIVTEPDHSTEEPQLAFTDMPQDADVSFDSLGEVRYATEYETSEEPVPQELTDEEIVAPFAEEEHVRAEESLSFTATEQELSDEQVSVAFGSESSADSESSQPVFETGAHRDSVEEQPAFDANDFAERDPLFEPLGEVDDGLSDYDGLSDVRVVSDSVPVDYENDQARNDIPEVPATVDIAQPAADADIEAVYTFEQPPEEIAGISDVDLDTVPEAAVSEPYQYDDLDDDLSQGAEEFISPRLTEVVEEDDQDNGLDFEKPITELFGHHGSHDTGPQQATMDLGEVDDFSEPVIPSEPAPVEPAAPVSRFSAVEDEPAEEEISHAPLIGENLSEPAAEHDAPQRQEPTFTDIEPEPMFTDPLMDTATASDTSFTSEELEPEQASVTEPSAPVVAPSEPAPQKRSKQSVPDADKVLVISVVTREEQGFNGRNLLQIVKACGMHFGEMQIFNRYEDGIDQGAIQFSMTNAMEPGIFDIDNMESLDTRGVTFFMSMEEPRDVMNAYECMLGTAEAVAKNLGGELLDENRSSMRTQTKEHYRERIRDFEMRKLKPQL